MDDFDRRGEPGGPRWLVPTRLESLGIFAAFTERAGGRSRSPFESLNLGFKEGDDADAVHANRSALVDALGVPPFATAEQVHGSAVAPVTASEAVTGFEGMGFEGADALTTESAGAALAILTADCVPLVLADGERLTVVHVGWRGAAAGIVAVAVAAFPDRRAVAAAIGPGIRACHYAVGEDVVAATKAGLGIEPPAERRGGSWYVDLPGAVEGALRRLGVSDVAACGLCTACEADRFFSYRRDGRTGRQGVIAVRR